MQGLHNNSGQKLEQELLGLLANQVRLSPLPVILSMGFVAYMAADHAPTWLWLSWFAGTVIFQLARVAIFPRLARQNATDAARRLNFAITLNACNTVFHSLSLAWFPMFTPFECSAMSMIFMGMGIVSITTTVGYRAFSLTHILLALLPLFTLWAAVGAIRGSFAFLSIGLVGLVYAATLLRASDRVFSIYHQSFDARQRLQFALNQTEAAAQAKTRFLASASHDLRQPIHALSLLGATLGMRPLDKDSLEILNKMQAAISALSHELDALLDMSKLDAGIVSVNRSSVALYPLLQRLCDDLASDAEARDIEIRLNCPKTANADTDPALLERVLRNLLANAVNHNRSCSVTASVVWQAESWVLTIEDTGTGIPLSEHDRVFEEFYQLDNPERDRNKGLGLGLSIVSRLAGLLQLNMQFDSDNGHGTRFTFTLPATRKWTLPIPETAPPDSFDNLSVLVVDDENAVREGMQALLEALGCRVATASGSDAAVEIARRQQPGLALIDFRLHGRDSGLITIKKLLELYPQLPTIIITGDTAPERLREARQVGVPVLAKPLQLESLKLAIAKTCADSQQAYG